MQVRYIFVKKSAAFTSSRKFCFLGTRPVPGEKKTIKDPKTLQIIRRFGIKVQQIQQLR